MQGRDCFVNKCKMAREGEEHQLSGQCRVYGDLTRKFSDLTDINSLVQFLMKFLTEETTWTEGTTWVVCNPLLVGVQPSWS